MKDKKEWVRKIHEALSICKDPIILIEWVSFLNPDLKAFDDFWVARENYHFNRAVFNSVENELAIDMLLHSFHQNKLKRARRLVSFDTILHELDPYWIWKESVIDFTFYVVEKNHYENLKKKCAWDDFLPWGYE